MDKTKNAAIILLGMGETHAGEILKVLSTKEVEVILEAINKIDKITEFEVVKALNEFFNESNTTAAIDGISKEHIKNSLISAVGTSKMGGFNPKEAPWLQHLTQEPITHLAEMLQEEHPQIVTAFLIIISARYSDYASSLTKLLPKSLQNEVVKRMATTGSISTWALEVLNEYFAHYIIKQHHHSSFKVDGVDAAANIISYLDSETEQAIITDISQKDETIAEKIRDKMFPFEKLAKLDNKSLQILLKEINPDELVMALKGADQRLMDAFIRNMSAKSAEILKDDLEAKGPIKLANVIEAQRKIIITAKKLAEEERIFLTTNQSDLVL
jgi:flagellar motor switch protein FliG